MIHFLKEIFKKKEEGPVFFNILTRTSGRPNGFRKCHESIQGQTFRHFSHIVSYDTHDDLTYLEEYDVKRVEVKKRKRKMYQHLEIQGTENSLLIIFILTAY